MLLGIALIVILFVLIWFKYLKQDEKFPPGPRGLPLVGYLPIFFEENVIDGLMKLHKKWGSVFSVQLGPRSKIVVIGDYEILKVML